MEKYKIKVNANSMASALELATITMKEHFYLGFSPKNELEINTFDNYGGSTYKVDIIENKNEGVNYYWTTSQKILDVLKSFNSVEVELTITEASTIISYKKTKIRVPNFTEYKENPYVKNVGLGTEITISDGVLNKIDECTSGYEADLKIGKVWSCLNISKGSAQATDSNNLIILELKGIDKKIDINIPKGALQNMLKISNQWSKIKIHDDRIYLLDGNYGGVMVYNLNLQPFPNVVGLFDKNNVGSPIKVNKGMLIQAINLLGIIRGKDNFIVEIKITKGQLELNYNKSKTTTTIFNEHDMVEGTFGIQGDRLIKMLNKLPCSEPELLFNHPLKPITYSDKETGIKALVMPMKLA